MSAFPGTDDLEQRADAERCAGCQSGEEATAPSLRRLGEME